MSTRLAVYELARRHGVPARELPALVQAAGLGGEPTGLQRLLWRGVAVLAAALVGLGLVFWLAANWEQFGRMGRFALLQGVLAVACLAAAWRPGLRAPFGLAALLAMGALFAFFGQTYQTGADSWQLFALWAVLALPLCLAARSDVLWAPWALVAMTGIALWTQAHTGHSWRVAPQDLGVHAIGWGAAALVVAGLGPLAVRWTGAGAWALRTAAALAVVSLMLAGVVGLFHSPVAPHYALALVVLALAAALVAQRRAFDLFVLCAVALALDTLLVAGLARLLFEGARGEPFGRMLLVGAAAAGLLAFSVSTILRLARRHAVADGTPSEVPA